MEALESTRQFVKLFSEAIKEKNIELIASFLSANGIFDTQNADLNTIESDKVTFVDWFSNRLNLTIISSVTFDQCIHCKIGNPVVLFNNGEFPRIIKDSSERSKTGLMLDIKEGKITNIKFCYIFAKTENKYKFECDGEQIKKHMGDGLSFEDAYKRTFNTDKLE
jgi:hypothetical protein